MALYDVADVIGKTLYPNIALDVYDHPGGTVIGTVTPPNAAGVVYSWVTGPDGALWWMFQGAGSNLANQYGSYYIKHSSGYFNVQALREQGVITTQEKIEEAKKANEDLLTRIGNIVKWVAVTVAGAMITKAVISRKK